MEKIVRVEPYGIIQMCDKCNVGEMLPTGHNSYMPEIKIEHKCSNCGELKYFKEKYPKINFRVLRD